MASVKTIHIPNVRAPKAFSSHPGHGDASRTASEAAKAVDRFRSAFPAEAAGERLDHAAKARRTFP